MDHTIYTWKAGFQESMSITIGVMGETGDGLAAWPSTLGVRARGQLQGSRDKETNNFLEQEVSVKTAQKV